MNLPGYGITSVHLIYLLFVKTYFGPYAVSKGMFMAMKDIFYKTKKKKYAQMSKCPKFQFQTPCANITDYIRDKNMMDIK